MRLKAIVVDNESAIRNGVVRHLSKAASRHHDTLEMSQAQTATGAAKLSRKTDFDFAIIDYDLGGGLTGIQLAIRLLDRRNDLAICLISAKEASIVEPALHAAIEDTPYTIQYREKPVSAEEWNNFYDSIRKSLLRGSDTFLFGELQDMYRQAVSAHERLRLLNLICERAVRIGCALFSSMAPKVSDAFLRKQASKPFIPASAFYNLADDLTTAVVKPASPGTVDADQRALFYLAAMLRDRLLKSARFVLSLENKHKHRSHTNEIQLRGLLSENRSLLDATFEFAADLRIVSFFRREFESEYCSSIIRFGRSFSKLETYEANNLPSEIISGAAVGQKYLDIKPLMLIEKCESCGRIHLFNLHRLDSTGHIYIGTCEYESTKIAP
jgi:hypothetical protein